MAIYKSYVEAVIANGSVNGVFTDGKRFYTDGTDLKHCNIKPCNPADHLETLEDFLARGLRLVNGDKYTGMKGKIFTVGGDITACSANHPSSSDDRRFALQVTADRVEAPEEKEAFDAMPNQATIDAMNDKPCDEVYDDANDAFSACVNGDGGLIEHDAPEGREAFDAMTDTTPNQVESLGKWEPKIGQPVYIAQINTLAGVKEKRYFVMQYWCNSGYQREYMNCGILFPTKEEAEIKTKTMLGIPIETPAEREERERLEAAYYLYCKCGIQHETVSFEKFKAGDDCYPCVWLDIVDKTGYRKQ